MEDSEDGDGLSVNNEHHASEPNPVQFVGWYLDFPAISDSQIESGERVIDNVVIRGGKAIVTSYQPNSNACSYGGFSWLYILNGCGEGDAPYDSGTGLLLPKRYPSRLLSNLVVIKEDSRSKMDHVLVGDREGRLIKQSFLGEYWGKVYWRQNTME